MNFGDWLVLPCLLAGELIAKICRAGRRLTCPTSVGSDANAGVVEQVSYFSLAHASAY